MPKPDTQLEPSPEASETALPATTAKPRKWLIYLALHAIFLLYSLAAVCAKLAAGHELFSVWFIFWYVVVLAILGIYAIVWQQVLRVLPLTTAFANKGVTLAWGMLWGALLFAEQISLRMLLGAALAFVGIIVVVMADAGNKTDSDKQSKVALAASDDGAAAGGERP